MNIVRVTATSDVLRTLHDIDGFELVGGGLPKVEPETEDQEDVWIVSAYATDEAIGQARARGADVEVVLDSDTRLAQLNEVAERARARMRDIESAGGEPARGEPARGEPPGDEQAGDGQSESTGEQSGGG